MRWLPWIGDNFSKSKGKLLVLGESNYKWKGEEDAWEIVNLKRFERDLIKQRYITKELKENKIKIFENIIKTVYNKNDISSVEKKCFFNAISYCVIVQRPFKNRAIRPNNNDFLDGWRVISKIIQIIKPKNILFLGTAAINYLLNDPNILLPLSLCHYKVNKNKINNTYPRRFILKNNDCDINCIGIRHASSYYTWKSWNGYIKKYINLNEIINKDV